MARLFVKKENDSALVGADSLICKISYFWNEYVENFENYEIVTLEMFNFDTRIYLAQMKIKEGVIGYCYEEYQKHLLWAAHQMNHYFKLELGNEIRQTVAHLCGVEFDKKWRDLENRSNIFFQEKHFSKQKTTLNDFLY